MSHNHLPYILHPATPSSSPSASFFLQLAYQPQGVPPATYNYYEEWGPAQDQALLFHASQIMTANPSTAGVTPTPNDSGRPCNWITNGVLCTQNFTNFDDLIVHLASVHDVQGTAERKLACRWLTDNGCCGREYRRDGFRRHIGTHVGLQVPCTVCGKAFSRSDSMRAHQKKAHSKA